MSLALAPDIDLSYTKKIITIILANDINTGDIVCVYAFTATEIQIMRQSIHISNGRKYLLSHVN